MPVSRMRMRPWLEKMIESERVSGLKWLDQDKTMFSVPWKHAARHGWEMDKDACLFKAWALHTGKYVEGQNSDPKTWKANFRCAMNSLPDVEEVKDKSINKGHQAVRVFRMLPATQKTRDKRCKSKDNTDQTTLKMLKMKMETDDSSDADSCTDALVQDNKTQENKVDSTVHFERNDFEFMPSAEVPDWSLSVEIGPESDFTNFSHRFEVSPDHTSEYTDIIEICQQLEKETQFLSSRTDSMGFLCNDSCTSPESPWSDSSSGDEPETSPRYLNLGAESSFQDDSWKKYLPGSFEW